MLEYIIIGLLIVAVVLLIILLCKKSSKLTIDDVNETVRKELNSQLTDSEKNVSESVRELGRDNFRAVHELSQLLQQTQL